MISVEDFLNKNSVRTIILFMSKKCNVPQTENISKKVEL